MDYLRVVNWEEFQHYRDRDPVWIKLHRGLLDNYEYARLQDASKSHLTGIWLLAARHKNRIPADPEWIGRRISATEPVNLQVLIDAKLIEMEQDASTECSSTLATCSLEERRGEEKQPTPPRASVKGPSGPGWPEALRLTALMPQPYQQGMLRFLNWAVERVPEGRRAHKLAELSATIDGAMRGLGMAGMRPATLEAIGTACCDFPGIEPPMEPSPANLRACIKRAERDLAKGTGNGRPSKGDRKARSDAAMQRAITNG